LCDGKSAIESPITSNYDGGKWWTHMIAAAQNTGDREQSPP